MITIYSQMACSSHEEILRYALENKYSLREFTPQELAQTLSISSHKAYRWISDMEASGLVSRDGRSHRLTLKAS